MDLFSIICISIASIGILICLFMIFGINLIKIIQNINKKIILIALFCAIIAIGIIFIFKLNRNGYKEDRGNCELFIGDAFKKVGLVPKSTKYIGYEQFDEIFNDSWNKYRKIGVRIYFEVNYIDGTQTRDGGFRCEIIKNNDYHGKANLLIYEEKYINDFNKIKELLKLNKFKKQEPLNKNIKYLYEEGKAYLPSNPKFNVSPY